jgi:hypothetical protein
MRMDLAHTFSELALQLDKAIEAFDSDTVSPQDAATLRLATTALQYQLDALAMKVETKIEADGSNIAYLNKPSRDFHETDDTSPAAQTVARNEADEEAVFEAAQFARVSGDHYDGGRSDHFSSTWDDGTEFEWIGSQCIVRHA